MRWRRGSTTDSCVLEYVEILKYTDADELKLGLFCYESECMERVYWSIRVLLIHRFGDVESSSVIGDIRYCVQHGGIAKAEIKLIERYRLEPWTTSESTDNAAG